MSQASSIREAFEPYHQDYRVRESRTGCVVSIILIPAGVSLDLVVYPAMLVPFLMLRFLCIAFIAGILALHFTDWGKQQIRWLMFAWSVGIQMVFCLMIYLTDGASSTYYAGLNLVVLAIGLVLPYTYREAIVFSVISLLLYLATCLLHGAEEINNILLYNNSYFIILTAVITVVAVYFKEKRRFEEFRLNYNLEQQNIQLEELDRYKSQFFANISHELRTPLTLILGPIEDILRNASSLDEKVASLMHTARENGLRLLKLVNDLLDLIRLESGKSNLNLRPVDISSYASGLVDSVRHLAETREISLYTDWTEESAVASADERAIERILMNLLSNAIKFTPKDGEVHVSTRVTKKFVVLSVADTGIGIGQDDLSVIFDRFRQADGSSTRKYTGAGIGLALVKELVDNMGGKVSVDSEPDVGTTMKVSFRRVSEGEMDAVQSEDIVVSDDNIEQLHEAARDIAGMPLDEPEGIYNPAGPETKLPLVLVVDDEPAMRRYLVDILSESYRVIEARDGLQGLELANRNRPDLMVLDLMLPEMDGHEVCRLLKQSDETRSIKLVMLTASIDEDAKLRALRFGADDFLTKPFGRIELLTRLKNLHNTQELENDLRDNNEELGEALSELKRVQGSLINSEKINALGKMSAGLLHEINNPLNYSLAALQMIRSDPGVKGDADIAEMVDDVNNGMERIRSIISDLRAFAYPSEADKLAVFPFSEAVENALRFTAAEMKSIAVELDIAKPDQVLGSNSHIVQVLVNLFSNSAKAVKGFRSAKAAKIRVVTRVEDNRYFVQIIDNGRGIDEETAQHIFEPFFTTDDVGEGMGMGLSICHTIVSNHGGRLTVDSTLGEETMFTFDLAIPDST
ncbi:MAG: ATP-binding protein [Pseudomonadota bacterium]